VVIYSIGMAKKAVFSSLNIKKRCRDAGVSLWQCPHFLFIIMGVVIIVSIIATDLIARRFTVPEVAALIVLVVSAFLFIVGHTIVRSFENIVEASHLKSEFVRIVSHEMRSPLSAIKWSVGLLKSGDMSDGTPDDVSSTISSIGEQNEKMIDTINILLEVGRAEDGRIELAPEQISLKALTEKKIEELGSFASASDINVSLEAEDHAVFADPQKIDFIISNLLENALRYSSGRSSVKIEIFKKDKNIFWRITDQGSGIPKEDRKEIFKKFFRSSNVYRYRSGGLGIRLFLSKAFVEASGGEIGFLPGKQKGSIFWFSLPETGRLTS